ncbi:alpha/beta hydrolase [Actinomycetes bacterium KLBMP 9759]
MTDPEQEPFFHDVAPALRRQSELIDVFTSGTASGPRPAVLFVHGGPLPAERQPRPRQTPIFIGYASMAAAAGLVGVTFDHRLYTDQHYAEAADDVREAVEQVRALDEVDPDRVGMWFFSGGGPLGADWLRSAPAWLRAIAWSYPLLAPLPGWPGDVARFDAVAPLAEVPNLPKLLIRVGNEHPALAPVQDAFVATARDQDAALEVIEIADADHGFEAGTYSEHAGAAVRKAMGWMASAISG